MSEETKVISEKEPVRWTNLAASVVVIVADAIVAYLTDLDARHAAIVALVAVAGLLGSGEVSRRQVVSPYTLQRTTGKTINEIS